MADDIQNNEVEQSQESLDLNSLWINRIDRRERVLKNKAETNHWERYIREYQGDFSEILSGSKVLPLNLIYAYVRTEIPSLYIQDPYFEFTPKKRTTIGSAKLKEIAVNDIWHRKKFKREIKKGIQDAKLIGHGWYKVGYNANLGNIEQFQDATENPDNEDYFFYRLNWRHVLFNDEAVDPPYDCTWIAHKFYIPLKTAKANPEWKNAMLLTGVKLSGADTKEDNRVAGSSDTAGDTEYAELYEIWDNTTRQVMIVSKQQKVGVMHSRPWPYEKMAGFPFLYLGLSFINDDPYGVSDVGLGEAHVLEKTKLRNAFLEHVKRGNRQLLTKTDNFTPEAKDAYRRGDDSALLECENPDAVKALPYAAFQVDAFGLESRMDDDLSQIWGQRAMDRSGKAQTQTRTKFELQGQNVGTTNRLAEEQNIIQDIAEEAAEKLSSLLEQFASEPYYVQLTGYNPDEVAVMLAQRPSATNPNAVNTQTGFTITGEDIKGPVDVRIREGSAVPLDKQSKIALLKELAQMYMQIKSRPSGPFIAALAKMLVEEAGLHELSLALEQEAQFEAKQMQAAQEQQMQAAQIQTGQKATELQLKAQELATNQQKVQSDAQIDLLGIVSEIKLKLAEISASVTERNSSDGE